MIPSSSFSDDSLLSSSVQLYGHLPPITKTIQVRRTRHAGHCWRNKDELINNVLLWSPTYGQAKQDDQLELTYSSYVRTQDVTLKTCQRRWMIGRSGERGSGISVMAARHDDDDDSLLSCYGLSCLSLRSGRRVILAVYLVPRRL